MWKSRLPFEVAMVSAQKSSGVEIDYKVRQKSRKLPRAGLGCKTVGFFFFLKSVKKSVKRGVRVLRARASHARSVSPQSYSLVSASFQTFCLTARAYLTTQKYRLFRSLEPAVKHAINELTFSLSPLPRNIWNRRILAHWCFFHCWKSQQFSFFFFNSERESVFESSSDESHMKLHVLKWLVGIQKKGVVMY